MVPRAMTSYPAETWRLTNSLVQSLVELESVAPCILYNATTLPESMFQNDAASMESLPRVCSIMCVQNAGMETPQLNCGVIKLNVALYRQIGCGESAAVLFSDRRGVLRTRQLTSQSQQLTSQSPSSDPVLLRTGRRATRLMALSSCIDSSENDTLVFILGDEVLLLFCDSNGDLCRQLWSLPASALCATCVGTRELFISTMHGSFIVRIPNTNDRVQQAEAAADFAFSRRHDWSWCLPCMPATAFFDMSKETDLLAPPDLPSRPIAFGSTVLIANTAPRVGMEFQRSDVLIVDSDGRLLNLRLNGAQDQSNGGQEFDNNLDICRAAMCSEESAVTAAHFCSPWLERSLRSVIQSIGINGETLTRLSEKMESEKQALLEASRALNASHSLRCEVDVSVTRRPRITLYNSSDEGLSVGWSLCAGLARFADLQGSLKGESNLPHAPPPEPEAQNFCLPICGLPANSKWSIELPLRLHDSLRPSRLVVYAWFSPSTMLITKRASSSPRVLDTLNTRPASIFLGEFSICPLLQLREIGIHPSQPIAGQLAVEKAIRTSLEHGAQVDPKAALKDFAQRL